MLRALGAPVRSRRLADGGVLVEVDAFDVPPFALEIAGDASSAAFLAAAAILTGSVTITGVGLNSTRIGFLEAAARMGATVRWETTEDRMGEPVGRIDAERSSLHGIGLEGPVVPSLIDELPLVAVLATQAHGETSVRGAEELRVKESDRIAALGDGLRAMGAAVADARDGFDVTGPTVLRGAAVDARGDHRIAMALAVAALAADGETRIAGWETAAVSWPGFERTLAALGADLSVET
jgi:3-phosphoshikimate 1-carboxyvinyltransferase